MRKKKLEFDVDESGCFITTSHQLNKDGYCYMWHGGKSQRAHRVVYQECFGEIPHGLVVRHKCDVRNCVNPEHLELGTAKENTQDIISRGRWPLGAKSGVNKITEDTAREIKKMLREGSKNIEIIRSLNVTDKIVFQIRYGKTWRHVD